MPLTEREAKVLGALASLAVTNSATVRELCRITDLTEGSIRGALMRLSRAGLTLGTLQGPTRWQSTQRGRLAINRPIYSDYRIGRP